MRLASAAELAGDGVDDVSLRSHAHSPIAGPFSLKNATATMSFTVSRLTRPSVSSWVPPHSRELLIDRHRGDPTRGIELHLVLAP